MKLFLIASLLFATPQDAPKDKGLDVAKRAIETAAPEAHAAIIKAQLPSYPLTTCAVSDEELGSMGEPIEHVVGGRLVRLCCKGCVKKVDADSATYFAKIDAAVVRAQLASYPLTTCVVSNEPLGDAPADNVIGTRLVRTCCKKCGAGVAKDPAQYMAALDKAYMDAQRPAYPSKTCVVSGKELGSAGEPVEVLYGTRLIRLCCKGCLKALDEDPKTVVAKLDEAARAAVKK